MSTDQFSSTLQLATSISDVAPISTSAKKSKTKMPDYSITIADVVLEAGSLRFVVDLSDSGDQPSSQDPYQSLDLEVILQEVGSKDRILLSQPKMSDVSSSTKGINISLGTSVRLNTKSQYQIEVHAEGTNKDGNAISFNDADGGTVFVQVTTVPVTSK